MTNKELLEAAARFMGWKVSDSGFSEDTGVWCSCQKDACYAYWNPLTSKSDLWDLAERAKLAIDFQLGEVLSKYEIFEFTVGNHESCALAVLNAVVAMGSE